MNKAEYNKLVKDWMEFDKSQPWYNKTIDLGLRRFMIVIYWMLFKKERFEIFATLHMGAMIVSCAYHDAGFQTNPK